MDDQFCRENLDRPAISVGSHFLISLSFLVQCFVQPRWRNNSRRDETIFRFGAELRKQLMVISRLTKRRTASASQSGDRQMRTLSFILAIGFVVAGPSLAGSSDVGLPGIGTFAYNGSPMVTSAPQAIVVAAR
jgi:hypothetical protein